MPDKTVGQGMTVETLLTPEMIARYTAAGYWSDQTVGDMLDAMVRDLPGTTALVDPHRRITYAELGALVNRLALRLHSLGIKKGDRVTAQLPNRIEAVAVYFAAAKIGAVICPVVPYYGAMEVRYILERSESVACIVPDSFGGRDYLGMLERIRPGLPALKHVIVAGDRVPEGTLALRDLLGEPVSSSEATDEACRVAALTPTANDVLALMFTSGTEAAPKAVPWTHNTTRQVIVLNSGYGLTQGDVLLCLPPIYHGFGLALGAQLIPAQIGGTTVLMDAFEPEAALQEIERERVTVVVGVPPQVISMLGHPNLKRYDLSSLRVVISSGAPMPTEYIRRLKAEWGCGFVTFWGATESMGGPITRLDDPPELISTTVGRAAGPSTEIVVFDERRQQILPPGRAGEMAVRGPFVHPGYYKDPEQTRRSYHPDGWFFTGDLAVIDEKGYVTFVGRMKDIINRGGEKISPREVEEHLHSHPKILIAAMVGMPDPRLGERNCAYVIPRPGETVTLEEVVSFLLERGLAKVKLPERLEVVDSLPLTPSGKVRKNALRDEIARKVSTEKGDT